MITALSCLTLEVYYRYLPLYKEDAKGKEKTATRGRTGRLRSLKRARARNPRRSFAEKIVAEFAVLWYNKLG